MSENRLKQLSLQYSQLVKLGSNRNLSTSERMSVRNKLTLIRREQRTIKNQRGYVTMTTTNQIKMNNDKFDLINYEETPERFFAFIREVCAIYDNSMTYDLLKTLITDQEKLNLFIDEYYTGSYNESEIWDDAMRMFNVKYLEVV